MSEPSLAALIDPVGVEEFFAEHFEKQRLLVRRNKPDYFNEQLTLDDIDRILTTIEASDEEVSVVDASRKISYSDYVYGDDTINVDRLLRLHDEGATIILNHLHRRHEPLAKLCAALELEFSAAFQTNVYLTPSSAQGFKPHFDTHDVFVLQVAGSKHWQLYDTPVELALKGHGDDARQEDPGPVTEEFDLRAGDTLYIPRGLVHDARSTDEHSLHITVGVMGWTWFDFMLEAVESLAAQDKSMRTALPRGFVSGAFDEDAFREKFAALAGKLACDVDPDTVLDGFRTRFLNRRPPLIRGQMAQLAHLDAITPDSIAGCRPYLALVIEEGEEALRIRFHENEISFPLHAAEAARFALQTPNFRVGDLPGTLDDKGKVVLVKRLVREGLVEVLEKKQLQ